MDGTAAEMDSSSQTYGLVMVSAGSREEAVAIARVLVAQQLAACVSIVPITSVYTWQAELHEAQEWQLMAKTSVDRFTALQEAVVALHSYDLPEIILLPIQAGLPAYLNWISATMQP